MLNPTLAATRRVDQQIKRIKDIVQYDLPIFGFYQPIFKGHLSLSHVASRMFLKNES